MKALRGTKRVCAACAARFYDLSREPIVCPSCGAQHVPDAPPMAAEARGARYTSKTGWRSRSFKPADAEPDDAAPEVPAAEDATEDATEDANIPGANDDVVLEDEPDEADISGLLDHEPDPKER